MAAPCPVLGFVVTVALRATTAERRADVIDADLRVTLDVNGLMVRGGGHRPLEYLVSREGAQATDQDRQLAAVWAARWANEADITVSDLVDLSEAAP